MRCRSGSTTLQHVSPMGQSGTDIAILGIEWESASEGPTGCGQA